MPRNKKVMARLQHQAAINKVLMEVKTGNGKINNCIQSTLEICIQRFADDIMYTIPKHDRYFTQILYEWNGLHKALQEENTW